ncbi:hypothetical protein GX51_05258 [Blastomyces parvus]|uniref:Uncharacterized protein n=1 Tax=Blastomyces parvus TaxID=2060905 RepID=A0A2B7WXY0_9EURO|nr:hypothetical protein GX51_05258 [Blastomyces parvus]
MSQLVVVVGTGCRDLPDWDVSPNPNPNYRLQYLEYLVGKLRIEPGIRLCAARKHQTVQPSFEKGSRFHGDPGETTNQLLTTSAGFWTWHELGIFASQLVGMRYSVRPSARSSHAPISPVPVCCVWAGNLTE